MPCKVTKENHNLTHSWQHIRLPFAASFEPTKLEALLFDMFHMLRNIFVKMSRWARHTYVHFLQESWQPSASQTLKVKAGNCLEFAGRGREERAYE
jgi:hypothetical protein